MAVGPRLRDRRVFPLTPLLAAGLLAVLCVPSRRAAAIDSPPGELTGRLEAHAVYNFTGAESGTESFDVYFEGRLRFVNGSYEYLPGTTPLDGPGQIQASGNNNATGPFGGVGGVTVQADWQFAYDADPGHKHYYNTPDELILGPIGADSPAQLHMLVPLTVSGTETFYDPKNGSSTEPEPWDIWTLQIDNPPDPYDFNNSSFAAAPLTVTGKQQPSGLYVLTVSGGGTESGQSGELIDWSVSGSFSDKDTFVEVVPDPPVVALPPKGQGKLSDPVTFTAYTDPPDAPVSWHGDLGVKPVISGHTLTTRYNKPGVEKVTATLAGGGRAPEALPAGREAEDRLQPHSSSVTSATTEETVVKVTFSPEHIRRPQAPKSIPDGIPPGTSNGVKLNVTITPAGQSVTLRPLNPGKPGTITLDGAQTVTLKGSKSVTVSGVEQTEPGSGGKLQVAAYLAGSKKPAATTPPFSICAHPTGVGFFLAEAETGLNGKWGQDYAINQQYFPGTPPSTKAVWSVTSDSGDPSDLDETKISEVITPVIETGIFEHSGLGTSGDFFFPTTEPFSKGDTPQVDTIVFGRITAQGLQSLIQKNLTKAGKAGISVENQYFKFSCARCGIEESPSSPPVRQSGFRLRQSAGKDAQGYYLNTQRQPAATGPATAGLSNGDSGIIRVDVK